MPSTLIQAISFSCLDFGSCALTALTAPSTAPAQMCAHTDTLIHSPAHKDQDSSQNNSFKPASIRSCCPSPWNSSKAPLLKVKAKVFTVAHEAPLICLLSITVTYVPPHTSYSTPTCLLLLLPYTKHASTLWPLSLLFPLPGWNALYPNGFSLDVWTSRRFYHTPHHLSWVLFSPHSTITTWHIIN